MKGTFLAPMSYLMDMYRHSLIGLCVGVLLSSMVVDRFAWAQESVPAALEHAFAEGDARALGGMMAASVDVSLFGARKRYSRNQARLLMESFFSSWPPAGFEMVDASRSASGWFIEARYNSTRPGSPLQLYVRLRRQNTAWLVKELILEASQHEDP